MSEYIGSTSSHPDLDWSQLKETILLLNLAVAQLENSMLDGETSVSTLSDSFTTLVNNLTDIKATNNKLNENELNAESSQLKLAIEESTTSALEKVHASIIAFQFYDRMSQRLTHVSQSLNALSSLISTPSSLYSPDEWNALKQSIRSKYSMEEERRMFDNVISGMSISDALAAFNNDRVANLQEDDEIELF